MPNMSPVKVKMPEQEPNVRNKNFLEVALGYTAEVAIEEAQRCLNCKTRPCVSGCPVKIAIPDFISKVAQGDFTVRIDALHEEGKEDYLDRMIHDLNAMIAELGSIETLKTDFISNVSHEIKTPITAIEGYAMLLQGSEDLSEEDAEYVEKILLNSKRLSELVGNMLLFSKIDNQAIDTKVESFSLDEQIRQSILLLEPKWAEKEIELDVDLESVEYEGNKALMMHVWNNLIDNAIKFTPEKSTVSIALRKDGDRVIFTVDDEGEGIAEENAGHIFDKFYQCDSSHKQEGNGLGLALVKSITDALGGSVSTENTEKGCRFTIVLEK